MDPMSSLIAARKVSTPLIAVRTPDPAETVMPPRRRLPRAPSAAPLRSMRSRPRPPAGKRGDAVPCYTIRRTRVSFEKLVYKPGHVALLMDALAALGYHFESDVPVIQLRAHLPSGTAVKIWLAGEPAGIANTVLYKDGRFQIPSSLKDRFTLEAVQRAYARQALKKHAARHGWLLREIAENEFELERR